MLAYGIYACAHKHCTAHAKHPCGAPHRDTHRAYQRSWTRAKTSRPHSCVRVPPSCPPALAPPPAACSKTRSHHSGTCAAMLREANSAKGIRPRASITCGIPETASPAPPRSARGRRPLGPAAFGRARVRPAGPLRRGAPAGGGSTDAPSGKLAAASRIPHAQSKDAPCAMIPPHVGTRPLRLSSRHCRRIRALEASPPVTLPVTSSDDKEAGVVRGRVVSR